ncbi:MAG: lipase family protein [Candidatus Babeliales bacterium]|nr:lipase family protein [Candidatus Babeliales bacterium]
MKLIYSLAFILMVPYSMTQDIEYLFAHGHAAGKKQFKYYKELIPLADKGLAFDCVDANNKPLYPSIIKIRPTAFGQELDIQVLTNAIQDINVPIVGIGVSKGAACWINTAAKKENINSLAALVLESPFANVNEIIHKFKFIDYLNYIPCGQFIAKKGAQKILCHYDPYGIQPIYSISKITNKNLPIFLIHSKQDKLIPINHSRRLYNKFLKNGFTNVYLIETDIGHHAGIIHTDQSKIFPKALNSFYHQFNLPYNKDIPLIDISKYQPDIAEVDKRIKQDTETFKEYIPVIIQIIIILLLAYFIGRNYLNLPKK